MYMCMWVCIRIYINIYRLEPKEAQTLCLQAAIFDAKNEVTRAKEMYTKALTLDPERWESALAYAHFLTRATPHNPLGASERYMYVCVGVWVQVCVQVRVCVCVWNPHLSMLTSTLAPIRIICYVLAHGVYTYAYVYIRIYTCSGLCRLAHTPKLTHPRIRIYTYIYVVHGIYSYAWVCGFGCVRQSA